MSAARFHNALWALAALMSAGCAVESRPIGLRGRNLELSLGKRPEKSVVAAELPPAMPPAVSRAGSNLEPQSQAAGAAPSASDKQALGEVLEHVQSLGQTSPEEQARLLEDLKSTDPSVWPMLAQYSRVAAARRRAEQGDPEPIAALPRRGSAFNGAPAVGSEVDQPLAVRRAVGSAQPAHAKQPLGAPALENVAGLPAMGQPVAQVRTDLSPAHVPGALPTVSGPAAPLTPAATEFVAAPATTGVLTASAASPQTGAPAAQGVVTAAYAAPIQSLPADLKSQLGQTISALEAQAAAGQAVDPQQQAQLRLLYLLAGRKDDALRPIAGLPQAQQAFWTNELFGLAAVLDTERQPDLARRAAEAANHLEQAQARLRESGVLLVRNIAFCTEVRSYGITKPFESHQFSPGQEVLLYAEIENFKSESTPEGYHTALKSSYEIVDSQGRSVSQHEFPLTEEHCQNVRRDFFIRYFLRLPEKPVDEGTYTLRLTIEDTLAQKTGQASIDFTFKRQ